MSVEREGRRLLVRGGRIVTAVHDRIGDIYVEDGRVALLGESLDLPADRVIDACGKYVLPGCVDPHTHILGGAVSGIRFREDFTAGTVAAAFGGTTSVINFCMQEPGQSFSDLLASWHEKLEEGRPLVDVGFHLAIRDLAAGGSPDDLARVVEEGVTSYKLFLAYKGRVMVDDETLFRTLLVAAESGALVMVHAENGHVIEVLVNRALADGRTEPRWHADTRPPIVEGEATHRATQLARIAGAPLYVVHVTCCEAIEAVARARAAGQQVFAETCTQYLFTDAADLERPGFEGAKYVFTPPPRRAADREELWRALARDVLSVVSSDHVPFDFHGHKTLGEGDFSRIPNGAPGIEDRLLMVHHFGVGEGRISLNRMVELLSTNPAKLFGLYPRKGTIVPGSDADLVVFDPAARHRISARTHHSLSDYNLYEGTEVVGAPEVVLVRGRPIVERGELVGRPGDGQFLRRARFGESLAPAATHAGAAG